MGKIPSFGRDGSKDGYLNSLTWFLTNFILKLLYTFDPLLDTESISQPSGTSNPESVIFIFCFKTLLTALSMLCYI